MCLDLLYFSFSNLSTVTTSLHIEAKINCIQTRLLFAFLKNIHPLCSGRRTEIHVAARVAFGDPRRRSAVSAGKSNYCSFCFCQPSNACSLQSEALSQCRTSAMFTRGAALAVRLRVLVNELHAHRRLRNLFIFIFHYSFRLQLTIHAHVNTDLMADECDVWLLVVVFVTGGLFFLHATCCLKSAFLTADQSARGETEDHSPLSLTPRPPPLSNPGGVVPGHAAAAALPPRQSTGEARRRLTAPCWLLLVPAEAVDAVEAELFIGEAQVSDARLGAPAARAGVDHGVTHAAVLQPARLAAVQELELPRGVQLTHLGRRRAVSSAGLRRLRVVHLLEAFQEVHFA